MDVVSLLTAAFVLAASFSAIRHPVVSTPIPLSQLLAEAEPNNPQVSTADHGARAARHVAPQVKTLPDPKFTYDRMGQLLRRSGADVGKIAIGVSGKRFRTAYT